jgi:hypothetical protein
MVRRHNPFAIMMHLTRRRDSALFCAICIVMMTACLAQAQEPAHPKAPPERTYSNTPFVHHIVLLDADGAPIRAPKPGEDPSTVSSKPVSWAQTCGKCHSDYDQMQHGWHTNFADADAPIGRNGQPWILTDVQTRTQIPVSYRGWKGTWHPYEIGINDFNFARLFGSHHTGGGALATSKDVRFKASGPLENDCLICHTSDGRYDAAARAEQITRDENFKYAPTLAAFLGDVRGTASKLRDTFDPNGPDARRAPKVTYDPRRFDSTGEVTINLTSRIPNSRCYFCHTNIDVGQTRAASAEAQSDTALEMRFQHDGDIHLAKGMLCVDCHRNGVDHMMARGYEGEYADRVKAQGAGKADETITTLSCKGCHYGTERMEGGRLAAPRPIHWGLPTIHFDKLSCTACHSGPRPASATSLVQTSMSHELGIPRRHTDDAAAPEIQEPVFLRDPRTGKITPNRVIYPAFWGRMVDGKITPIRPEIVLAAGTSAIFGPKPPMHSILKMTALTDEQVMQVLEKLASAKPVKIKPADVIMARVQSPATAPTSAPASAPSKSKTAAESTLATTETSATGEPVYVTGGKAYKRSGDGKKLESFDDPAAAPYAWPLAHNVRSAQQALGARGCTECHSGGAPVFEGNVDSAALLSNASFSTPMFQVRGDSIGAMRAFGLTYPLRPVLIFIGYACAIILALLLLTYATWAVASLARRA